MSGIGIGSQLATHDVLHAAGLPGCGDAFYKASELPESRAPGILGQNSLAEKGCPIDCAQKSMYAVGPGGYEIRLSPGSLVYPLKSSKAGHLMLPCAEFGRGEVSSEVMTFTVGPHFEEWQELSSAPQAVIHHRPDAEGDKKSSPTSRVVSYHAPKSGGSKKDAESIDEVLKTAYEDIDSIFNAVHDELDKLAVVSHSASSATTPRAQAPSPAVKTKPKKKKGKNH